MSAAKSLSILVLLTVAPIPSSGEIVPTPGSGRIEPSFASADLVCVGRVTGVREVSRQVVPQPANKLSVYQINGVFALSADRCYKGGARRVDISFVTHSPSLSSADVHVSIGDDLLVLLRRSSEGTFEPVDPWWSRWDAELVTFAEPDSVGLRQLERDLAQNMDGDRGAESRIKNLRILHALDSVSGDTMIRVRRLFSSSDPQAALEAFSIAVKAGKAGDLIAFDRYLKDNPQLTEQMVWGHGFSSIQDVTDRDALGALESLARSRFTWLGVAAMDGIRHLRDPASIPELVKYLDDPDPRKQFFAAATLSEITGLRDEDHTPTMKSFHEDPARFIVTWKQWWTDTGRTQYQHE